MTYQKKGKSEEIVIVEESHKSQRQALRRDSLLLLTSVCISSLCNYATLNHNFPTITCSHGLGETVLLLAHALLGYERPVSQLKKHSLDNSDVQDRYLQQQILLKTKLWLKSIISCSFKCLILLLFSFASIFNVLWIHLQQSPACFAVCYCWNRTSISS